MENVTTINKNKILARKIRFVLVFDPPCQICCPGGVMVVEHGQWWEATTIEHNTPNASIPKVVKFYSNLYWANLALERKYGNIPIDAVIINGEDSFRQIDISWFEGIEHFINTEEWGFGKIFPVDTEALSDIIHNAFNAPSSKFLAFGNKCGWKNNRMNYGKRDYC